MRKTARRQATAWQGRQEPPRELELLSEAGAVQRLKHLNVL